MSLTTHGSYGACRLESALLRFARSHSLRSGGPILPYSLRLGCHTLPYSLRSGVGHTDRRTHIPLFIEDATKSIRSNFEFKQPNLTQIQSITCLDLWRTIATFNNKMTKKGLFIFHHSILFFTIMVDKFELRNNFFSTSFPIPPRWDQCGKVLLFRTDPKGGPLETMILLFHFFA